MDYLAKEKQYLAIQVDDSGKVSIDNDNLLNLLRIKMDLANQKNMVKFNTTKNIIQRFLIKLLLNKELFYTV